MMRIPRIEPVTKTKYRVSVDEQFAFVVYKGELSRFHLKEECELTEDTYAKIKEVLLKRAKLRAMHLLNDMARTESQLRDKLKLGGYPSEITEAAIAYVKSFGYINDDAYIRNFIDSRKDKKSRREIYALLRQKGVDMNRAEEIMEAIRELLRKKHWDFACTDPKEKQKIYGYLVRKGFRYEDIRQVIQVCDWNA